MFENGHGGVNSDHTPFDAMVNVVMSHFIGKICLIFMCFSLIDKTKSLTKIHILKVS